MAFGFLKENAVSRDGLGRGVVVVAIRSGVAWFGNDHTVADDAGI